MKRRIARALRRLAARFEPESIRRLNIEWKRGEPPYVEIDLRGRQRVAGWVHPTP